RLVGRSIGSRYQVVDKARLFAGWAIGCALFIRAECFDSVAGFDEQFFLYAEERDLLRRTHDFGWLHQTHPEFEVCHSASMSPLDVALFAQRFRADLYYARKWGGP